MMRYFLHLNNTTEKLLVTENKNIIIVTFYLLFLGRVAKEELLKSKLSSHVLGKVMEKLFIKAFNFHLKGLATGWPWLWRNARHWRVRPGDAPHQGIAVLLTIDIWAKSPGQMWWPQPSWGAAWPPGSPGSPVRPQYQFGFLVVLPRIPPFLTQFGSFQEATRAGVKWEGDKRLWLITRSLDLRFQVRTWCLLDVKYALVEICAKNKLILWSIEDCICQNEKNRYSK